MRVEKAGDLMFFTYYMIKWDRVKQEPSDVRCTDCGQSMYQAEPAIDSMGHRYDGYVCHTDKRLIWVKAG